MAQLSIPRPRITVWMVLCLLAMIALVYYFFVQLLKNGVQFNIEWVAVLVVFLAVVAFWLWIRR